jgi:hypothetical protein
MGIICILIMSIIWCAATNGDKQSQNKTIKISQFFLHKDGRFMGFYKYEIIRFSPSKMEVFL